MTEANDTTKPETIERMKVIAELFKDPAVTTYAAAKQLGLGVNHVSVLAREAVRRGIMKAELQRKKGPARGPRALTHLDEVAKLYEENMALEEIGIELDLTFHRVRVHVDALIAAKKVLPRAANWHVGVRKRNTPARGKVVSPRAPKPHAERAPAPLCVPRPVHVGPMLVPTPAELREERRDPSRQCCEWITSNSRPWTRCGEPAPFRPGRATYCDRHRMLACDMPKTVALPASMRAA